MNSYKMNPLFFSKDDAEKVLDAMKGIVKERGFVFISDLRDLVGESSIYEDTTWGWSYLHGVIIRELTNGKWFIDFPDPTHVPLLG